MKNILDDANDFAKELLRWEENKLVSKYKSINIENLIQCGIIVYGASAFGMLYVSTLIERGITPKWIVDKNVTLHGSYIKGVEIRPLDSLFEIENEYVIIASSSISSILLELKKHGIEKWLLSYAIHQFAPIVGDWGIAMVENIVNSDLINSISLFSDEKSKQIYKQYIKFHFLYDNDFSALHDKVDYFPDDLREVIDYSEFIDCGAYDGDTLRLWMSYFLPGNCKEYRYYCIEPDCDNYILLHHFVSSLPMNLKKRINLLNIGVGKVDSIANVISHKDSATVLTNNQMGTEVKIFAIDSLFKDHIPTVIKADVEGFELDLLQGAMKTICRCRPTLIIKVYHKFSDIYKIPIWIDKLNLGYKLYLRHPYKTMSDTCLYAIPFN